MVIWYISPHFGMLYEEKSGNPAPRHKRGQQAAPPIKSVILLSVKTQSKMCFHPLNAI
jgi:hypothetical protein